ncbi:PPE domain-containing protein [Mycolicibacterium chlorophenolicum]|uniref:Putative PPE family protein PPE29 n=1 Tax=Mycolicibacterium chlorophenolicum TaxID=37916 RepID=A0A0J6VJN4_9MYCO|nr:PPE domain-containing protein [Mycolicibacterium chlorophenolicum]KMO69792.1 putative PPE family protein PPE29 [Mycolicibacterium chlorophenolicum]
MSAFGDAAAVPPEVNHTLMSTGDLGASLVSAAAGYESVADMLMAELTAMGLNTSTTAMVAWQGPGGVMMQMTAAEFMAVCAAASAWVRIGQVQAAEVATAHATAVESMIPAEVCTANLATTQALSDTNAFGINTPAILYLVHQYGEFWLQNATARTGYGSVVSTALGVLAEPAPFSPTASNPAGPAVAVAQDAAMQGGQSALQTSAKTMTQAADTPAKDAAAVPNSAESMVSQLGGQMGGLFGQVSSGFGQVTQMGQQLPQMLGQAPQMFSGMLGPLSSMQGLNATSVAPEAAGALGAPPVGGLSALAGGGGGGGGLVSGPSALSSSFVRPASSFSTPNSPTLPGGWLGSAEQGGAAQAKPAISGGGMYGAPPGLGREGHTDAGEKSTRTMQVTARPGTNRGERQRI